MTTNEYNLHHIFEDDIFFNTSKYDEYDII